MNKVKKSFSSLLVLSPLSRHSKKPSCDHEETSELRGDLQVTERSHSIWESGIVHSKRSVHVSSARHNPASGASHRFAAETAQNSSDRSRDGDAKYMAEGKPV
ncbi:hypothetical protein FHS14_001421 [Paenibacillus baekrokdamisoli]|nr:hypothetical protein [Paenibacillus baekrokdamisoli]